MKTFSRLAISALALALIAGCGGGGSDNPGGTDPGGTNPGGTDPGVTSYTVTPSVSGGGGSINPASAVSVQKGNTASFTLTPEFGYAIDKVEGTCGGALTGNTYKTNPVNANCTVVAKFNKQGGGGTGEPSIAACFTVTKTVSYALSGMGVTKSTVGPTTYNGQAAVGSATFYTDGSVATAYDAVTSSGVISYGVVTVGSDSTSSVLFVPPMIFPLNMQPGESINGHGVSTTSLDGSTVEFDSRWTFVGFESITLAGKTFTNVCHFRVSSSAPDTEDWIAPGYSTIKSTVPTYGLTTQYAGDL